MRKTAAGRTHIRMMEARNVSCNGVLPVRICQAGRAPGPLPRRGPPSVTGGHHTSICGVGYLGQQANTTDHKTKPVNILQWNAEGISTKKVPLTERLRKILMFLLYKKLISTPTGDSIFGGMKH